VFLEPENIGKALKPKFQPSKVKQMKKKLNTFKMFMVAVSTFFAAELADSPLRSLSYMSVVLVAGGNFWMKMEEKLTSFKEQRELRASTEKITA